MSPLKPGYPTTAGPEYSNTAATQENDLNTNFMKMIEVLKEEMNKPLKESQENTNNQRKLINTFKKEQNSWKEINKTVQDLKMETEAIKKSQT